MGASAENAGPPTTCDAFLGGRLMLHQPKKGHRAGHDAILLAAFCRAQAGESAADFGAGIGAAGLALACRVDGARFDASVRAGALDRTEIEPRLLRHAAGRAARRAGQSRRRIAIAAGLGAVACVTAAWLALRGATGGGPIAPPDRAIAHDGGSPGSISGATGAAPENADVELEAMFLASSLLSGGMDEELASISAQAASVGLGLTDPVGSEWSESLMSGESL